MIAPDKIYVNFPVGEKYPWRGPMVTEQGLNQHDMTYIRKDALLEWVKLAYGKISMNPFDCSEAFEELLNKVGYEE